jgi:hypothetical protein
MRSRHSRVVYFATFAMLLLIVGCSSTTQTLVSQWSNPNYQSPSFRRVIVAGAGTQTSIRRNFEDEFVTQLRADGIDAIPSYRYIPEFDNPDLPRLKKAAQEAGADAAIVARAVNVEQKTEFAPSYYPVPSFGFFGSHFGASWYGPYGYPSVSRYDVYTSEISFYDLRKDEVVWTGTVRSTEADDVHAGIKSYVETVMKALEQRGVIGARR